MKLSEDADYLAHARCRAQDDFMGAVAHLQRTLERARSNDYFLDAPYLLVNIGRMLHFAGHPTEGEASFEAADAEANGSSLIRYFIASFYEEHGEDRDSAVRWLKKVLGSKVPSEAEQSRDGEALKYDRYYKGKALELLAKISPDSAY